MAYNDKYILKNGENDFWALNEDVLYNRAGGRVIWQPRIGCWVSDKMFAEGKLPGEYEGCTMPQIYRKLGCSARIYEYSGCFQPIMTESVKGSEKWLDENTIERVIETPVGRINSVERKSKNSWYMRIVKRWVETEADLKVFAYIEDNTDWRYVPQVFEDIKAEWGRLGAPCIIMPRVSVQKLYVELMGVENAVYAISDYPDTIKAYFKSLSGSQMRMIDRINESPIEIVNYGDNIHSGTLSPLLFKEYVLEEYQKRSEKLHAFGKFAYSHYDGNNKGLMEYYQETGMDGIEAITPVPQGDVTLEEVKKYLGDMYMIDGIPAVYFDNIFSVDTLKDEVKKLIDLFAPHLVLGISDEISSTGDIERIRVVGEIVDQYNATI